PSFKGLKPTGIWAPGDTHIRSLVVYNDASLDAVLDKVSAQVEADTKGMASQMNVAVYKILPKYLPNGTPFAPIPGDDCLDQDLLDHASRTINPLILMANAFGVEDLTQKLIENQVQCNAVRLYSGKLSDLVSVEQSFSQGVAMKSKNNQFVKRGCLLAFVVQLDKNAGNEYQDADAQFGFTVTARQAKNQ
ncbi:MAG: hypothetical protein M1486_04800, partial [Gammaproteobacteria bacterium]|nr:hypothetical protein [Gammaproteobacteria bacterium]